MIATLEGALMISRIEGSRMALRDARESLEGLLNEIACEQHKARSAQTSPKHSKSA
jgi:hypothetical protein